MNANRKKNRKQRQIGSALLVSLMVMVGLSLLGLGFVVISETESAIAANERNVTQVREAAEAGVKVAVEWFQDPEWAKDQKLLPPNVLQIKTSRTLKGVDVGYYKATGTGAGATAKGILFDKPHKGADENRFFGTYDNADVIINNTKLATASAADDKKFLDDLNKALFADTDTGQITEIRVYAPPMTAAKPNDEGFYDTGSRLGLATIAVTAMKCRNSATNPTGKCQDTTPSADVLAQRTVRAVISEWPYPGPSGPVETNAKFGSNGNLQIHWGRIQAQEDMSLKRPYLALPWHDAYTTVCFQFGYADGAADPANNPWPIGSGSHISAVCNQYKWLHQLVGQSLEDPWYEARTRGDYSGDGNGGAGVAYKYDSPNQPLIAGTTSGMNIPRSIFQAQTQNLAPDFKAVLFPRFDYDFWKDVAVSADDQDAVNYLTWKSGDTYRDKNGTEKTFEAWTDSGVGAKPGFYFFETQNSLNPQNDGPGVLAPTVGFKGNGQIQGFVYLNANWDSSGGATGISGLYNFPGEPYKDIGYPKVNKATNDWDKAAPADPIQFGGASNGTWDFQDLPQSQGGAGENKVFDYVVESRTVPRPATSGGVTGNVTTNFIKPYYPGCNPGVNCSEPHEPYLNLQYPASATSITMGWEAGTGTARSKKTTDGKPTSSALSCSPLPTDKEKAWKQCTSNSYDRDGALVTISPMLNGVLYTEGAFEATGNIHFFGSVICEGDFSKAGTPDVWFDERLVKDEWPPKEFRFPRVFVSAVQTD